MKTLVVARFDEDVSWAEVDGWDTWVVQKDRDVPNVGREASSFLYAMGTLSLTAGHGDLFAFVQGNPFPHCPDLKETLPFLRRKPYTPLGDQPHVDDWHGQPHHPGLPIRKFWADHIGGECPTEFPFVAGGQFAINGGNLLSREPEWYFGLQQAAEAETDAPWILERLWGTILA